MRIIRAACVTGIIGAFAFMGGPATSSHSINFTDCGGPTVPPLPTDETFTPPPTEAPENTPPPLPSRTPAAENCVPASGEEVWGDRLMHFTVSGTAIRSVELHVRADEEGISDGNGGEPLEVTDGGTAGLPGHYYSTWETETMTPQNGVYKIEVSAVQSAAPFRPEHTDTAERTGILVNNRPQPVGQPQIIAKTSSSVNVQWPAATEPDVLSYTVYRAVTTDDTPPGFADLEQHAIVTENSFRDSENVVPGNYWYAVSVTRRSVVTPESGISSQLSPISGIATVLAPGQTPGPDGTVGTAAPAPVNPRTVPFRQLSTYRGGKQPPVPDAPYSAYLPYNEQQSGVASGESSEPGGDPRGAVLPVAVGAFLVSSALALGRMPY